MFSVAGARALIAGGASGIGAAVAQALTEAGCHVIAADLPGAPLPTDRRIESTSSHFGFLGWAVWVGSGGED